MAAVYMHTCPVCGYDQLSEPPKDFTICPSCGTEFGYDDVRQTVGQLLATWLQTCPRWWYPPGTIAPGVITNVLKNMPWYRRIGALVRLWWLWFKYAR